MKDVETTDKQDSMCMLCKWREEYHSSLSLYEGKYCDETEKTLADLNFKIEIREWLRVFHKELAKREYIQKRAMAARNSYTNDDLFYYIWLKATDVLESGELLGYAGIDYIILDDIYTVTPEMWNNLVQMTNPPAPTFQSFSIEHKNFIRHHVEPVEHVVDARHMARVIHTLRPEKMHHDSRDGALIGRKGKKR